MKQVRQLPSTRQPGSSLAGFLVSALLLFLWILPVQANELDEPRDLDCRDLSLNKARQLALANSEARASAEEAISSAKADWREARSGSLPQLAVGGVWTNNLKKPSFFLPADMASAMGLGQALEMGGEYDVQAALKLSWNLWTSGRLSAARKAAGEAVEAARWKEALVEDLVRFQVEQAYFDALLAAETLHITELAKATSLEALRVTNAACREGTASRFELLRAQVEAENRAAPLKIAQNSRQQANLKLLRLCALPADCSLQLSDSLRAAPQAPSLDVLRDLMLASSAEMHILQHVKAARKQQVKLAKAERGPVLMLQSQLAWQAQWEQDLWPASDEAAHSASAGLALSIPIYTGQSTQAKIGKARSELKIADKDLEQCRLDQDLALRQARLQLESVRSALEGREDGVGLAEEAHRLAIVRLENGLATPLERMDAELALTEARVQLAEIQHAGLSAHSALRFTVGTDLPNPLEQ